MSDKFKVGDRVIAVQDNFDDEWSYSKGDAGKIIRCDGDGTPRCKFDDDDREFFINDDHFELLTTVATDELTELRAFRDMAIERYPDLAPVDADLQIAIEVTRAEGWESGTDCRSTNDDGWYRSVTSAVYNGIKRGRELERSKG